MVIWITGISGAGKTTLCEALWNRFEPRVPQMVMIDGDIIREMYDDPLGFDAASRRIQIGRIQRLARALDNQGKLVLVAALYSDDDLLAWNRSTFSEYFEVYLKASIDLVSKRDPKGLYKKALNGQMKDVVGIDIEWNPPKNPDLVIDTELGLHPQEIASLVAERISHFAKFLD